MERVGIVHRGIIHDRGDGGIRIRLPRIAAVHGGGLLDKPLDSTGFESWGSAGKGQWITVYANSGHAFAVIAGLRFDTSGDAQGTGPRWHTDMRSGSGYVVRHPDGF